MRENRLRRLKDAGTLIVNGWMSIGSSYAAEILGHQGFDSVTVDCQHGMIGFETLVAMLQGISASPAIPLVRPSKNDPAEIMRCLDAGAYGVICPMISNAEDAARLVDACRYPPVGTRSYGPSRGILYGGTDYVAGANDEILVLAMVETAEGLEKVDEIVATPGLDGIYVGPNDLGLSLGRSPECESRDPVMMDAVGRILASVLAQGKMAGIFCSGGPGAAQRVAQGFHLVTPGNDAMALRAATAAAITAARAPG